MLLVELKPLVGRLNEVCRQALENAAGLCVSGGHAEITVEHFLFKLLEPMQTDAMLLLQRASHECLPRLRRDLDRAISACARTGAGRPVFSAALVELLQDAWLVASIDLQHSRVRSGAILLAFVGRARLFAQPAYAELVGALNRASLMEQFDSICGHSLEAQGIAPEGAEEGAGAAGVPPQAGEESAIARYCEVLTDKAREGRIDPVFGRDSEIRLMIDILTRRRKNNPICVGEAGVGKTAVVEGLAMRIVSGAVPQLLRETAIVALDMGLLQAGAGVKGEFEQRLKRIIAEVRASTRPIILFIDEAHMLIGAGGQAGTADAANLFKPALARGELRTIAATTWAEYRKYFESDAALSRRFQPVHIGEPDIATTTTILRGLKANYEAAHQVLVNDQAIVAAAELSARFIPARQLPDKAVDLLDTACARVRLQQDTAPAALEALERRIDALNEEARALHRDHAHHHETDARRLPEIASELQTLGTQMLQLRSQWMRQREAGAALIAARTALAQAERVVLPPVGAPAEVPAGEPAGVQGASGASGGADGDGRLHAGGGMAGEASGADVPPPAALPASHGPHVLRAQLAEAARALREAQAEGPLLSVDVDAEAIARVVSDWTGIPVGKVLRDQAHTVLGMAQALGRRVRGQDAAITQITQMLRTSAASMKEPQQPMGVFLLVGPSGVGKTETAHGVAECLFGDEQCMVTINMSEFQERHMVSRLIGSPPGYVGYGEGGRLTEAVRRRPYSVVLLDEVEKAHPDVLNLFYQVFDKGVLSDGEGNAVDFSNTVIFLTSNLASELIAELTSGPVPAPVESVLAAIRPALCAHFQPALLARMTVIPYHALSGADLREIVVLKLAQVAARLARTHRCRLVYAEDVISMLCARCTEAESGARNIDYILRGTVLPLLSGELLARMDGAGNRDTLQLALGAGGALIVH